jgi:hypothetical protein
MRQTPSNLDDLVVGTLPDHVISAIGKMELTVEDLQEFNSKSPIFSIVIEKGYIVIKIRIKAKLRIPTKKLIITIGSVVSLLGVITKVIVDNWATIKALIK